ncbi:MAG: HDIG domain-containing protein [Planctomycetota bacterium]|nr:HDIG domain-containing protein [Planctomycetota bacterium]
MSWLDFLHSRGGARRGRAGAPAGGGGRPRDGAPPKDERRSTLGPMGWGFCVLLVAAVVVVMDYGVLPPPLHEADQAPSDFYARETFSYWDRDYIKDLRDLAAKKAPQVFRAVPNWRKDILEDLGRICEIVEGAGSLQSAKAAVNDRKEEQLVERLHEHYARAGKGSLKNDLMWEMQYVLTSLDVEGVLSREHFERYWARGQAQEILVRREENGPLLPMNGKRLRSVLEAQRALGEKIGNYPRYSEALQLALTRHLDERLKPNLGFDAQATEEQQQQARLQVPDQNREVKRDTQILAKGDPVGSEQVRMLREEAYAYKAALPLFAHSRRLSGLAALSGAILFLVIMALRRLQPEIFRHRRQMALLAFICLAVLLVAKVLMLYELPRQLVPAAFAVVTASLAFSQGVALVVALALALLVGFMSDGNMALALALLTGAFVAALPAKRLQRRFDLLKYGLLGGLAHFGVVLLLSPLRGSGIMTAAGLSQFGLPLLQFPTYQEAPWGLANCAACGLLLSALLPALEIVFGIVTNTRLYELADPTQPALRKIQLEAPGTWAHTLQVASLVEPAVEAIGGNVQLARTGTYYHDLGKTLKPEYFVENQMGAEERHLKLAPSVSALIITSHVKDGIQLARDFGLPQQIVDFIPEHHGTTLVSFFFHSAQKKAEAEKGAGGASGEVQESFFRYPGPKPQSRETGVLMLADTIEAASRTLEAPSATRLQQFVHDLIMAKLLDNQLDECDLTFRDLAVVEETFLRVLVGRFHGRVRYPGQEKEPRKPAGGSGVYRSVAGGSGVHKSVGDMTSTRKIPREMLLSEAPTEPDLKPASEGDKPHERTEEANPGPADPDKLGRDDTDAEKPAQDAAD